MRTLNYADAYACFQGSQLERNNAFERNKDLLWDFVHYYGIPEKMRKKYLLSGEQRSDSFLLAHLLDFLLVAEVGTQNDERKQWAEHLHYFNEGFRSPAELATAIYGPVIRGKKILDLGCGSRKSPDHREGRSWGRDFEPWLCRGLKELKLFFSVHPIGVDISCLEGEMFEHYSRDLRKKDALSMIPEESIDYAHASLLFNSPSLPGWQEQEMKENLLLQLRRVLKPEGIFFYNGGTTISLESQ